MRKPAVVVVVVLVMPPDAFPAPPALGTPLRPPPPLPAPAPPAAASGGVRTAWSTISSVLRASVAFWLKPWLKGRAWLKHATLHSSMTTTRGSRLILVSSPPRLPLLSLPALFHYMCLFFPFPVNSHGQGF